MYAIIDIGSNTIRLCVYTYEGEILKTIVSQKSMAGLAADCLHGNMTQRGIDKLCNCLAGFKETLENLKITNLHVFATASIRNVENSQAVLAAVKKRTGIEVDLISGEQEAIMDFVGATKQISEKNGILIDIGGGSTEVVLYKNLQIKTAFSVPLGSLNTYTKFVNGYIPTEKECKEIKGSAKKEIEKYLSADENLDDYKIICGVGGSVRGVLKLANQSFDLPLDNNVLNFKQIDALYELLIENPQKIADLILEAVPDRFRTIMTGLTILRTLVKSFDCKNIEVSTYGVREGYLFTKVMKGSEK